MTVRQTSSESTVYKKTSNGKFHLDELFVNRVLQFSSQYGAAQSMCYIANNLVGPPEVYPKHGDFTCTCVFRTYGPWWKMAPSAPKSFGRFSTPYPSDDFVEILFERMVYPIGFKVYETYNPGAIVKVMACDRLAGTCVDQGDTKWNCVWSGPPQKCSEKCRIFEISFKPISYPTNLFRIEFHHQMLQYYTEIDAIQLIGYKPNLENYIVSQISFSTAITSPAAIQRDSFTEMDGGYFKLLPQEILFFLLSYLDQVSLCLLSQTCKYLRDSTYDAFLWTKVNLKPYWYKVSDKTLNSLVSRCKKLNKLDVSWCNVTDLSLKGLLVASNTNLICLRLACCDFITLTSLQILVKACRNLEELDLQNCSGINCNEFEYICRLEQLENLNLYSTTVTSPAVLQILKGCLKLRVLNLGSCFMVENYDKVAEYIAKYSRCIECLDFWRARSLSSNGLFAIINNNNMSLQELDLGWVRSLLSESGCFIELVRKCPNLKKLFLTANRTVCNEDLINFAEYGCNLEQLDILGIWEVSEDCVYRILQNCHKLRFLDVSFCDDIKESSVNFWRQAFPHVSIKKSYSTNH
ncbi:F-box/LRR-repeat protein 4 [Octopus bimaculoides]|uniref:F-box domain-containing protein n=1 Tax=Octopus bimaculoides TaxID=37653 RepID=A0A0L8IEA6_OCTBM|nr:F-box/LRR-repeat protein 4 [Octopus bimaculoides]XP_014773145.1 F-box/LRR-repeat protein 4 [Octopus bimaculoides]|eukprot:XP_014773136.1 PREDICTED: F-box/LRR-repeat protein 4-like [Octopus bimaculoides]